MKGENFNPKAWQELHDGLRDGLQKEVHLTRELLSNLHQEEVSLMLHDSGSLNQIMQQRSHLLERLSVLRLQRLKMTRQIEEIASINNAHPTLEEILPPSEEISNEILSLSDQLSALNERMNRQHTQNQHLAEHPDRYHPPQMQPEQARPKRKASIATFHIKK
jgi:chromosome segregation ATPase